MTAAHWCVLIAALLPYPFAVLAKADRSYNNRDPRNEAIWAEGFRKRAWAAQQNGFEAFPPFAAAVIIAWQLGGGRGLLDPLAVAWVVLRIAYGAAYLADRPTLRSLLWTLAFADTLAIFLVGAFV